MNINESNYKLSNASLQLETVGVLVDRLVKEHEDFSSKASRLHERIKEAKTSDRIIEIVAPLKDALIEHMLAEETEIFPEVTRRGLFSERISEIMQQHIEITSALDKMKFALHGKDILSLSEGLSELSTLMKVHFPSEEKEVFSIVI